MLIRLFKFLSVILLSSMIFILTGCGDSGTSSPSGGVGAVSAKLVWDGIKTTAKSVASAPAAVATVRFIISGPTMTTMQQDFTASNGSGTISNVPAGSGLSVTASALDASGTIIFQGTVNNVTVLGGQTTNVVTIIMLAPLTSIAVTPASPSITVGATQQFKATGTYSDGSIKDLTSFVTWSSSNTSSVTITTSGIANAVTFGLATITATSGTVTISTTLTVQPASTLRTVTTIAGASNYTGWADGTGSAARFNNPYGLTTDGTNLYVAEATNHTIRKIVISTGVVTTIAGSPGVSGNVDGTGAAARFLGPRSLTTDGTNLYVADSYNSSIRKIVISTGVVTTIAGSPNTGYADGTGSAAKFYYPYGITTDGTNLYVTDTSNSTIRKIVISTGVVTTIAGSPSYAGAADGTGSAAQFNNPKGITTDGTNLYVSDTGSSTIRKIVISTGFVTTIAGSPGVSGYANGTGSAARFNNPYGLTTDGTNLYVADWLNFAIRKIEISSGSVSFVANISDAPLGITMVGTTLFTSNVYHSISMIQ